MSSAQRKIEFITLDEFWTAYEGAPGRNELVDGVVRSMSPASAIQSQIQGNIMTELSIHFRNIGSRCRAAINALDFKVQLTDLYAGTVLA